jgi:hypothetical protein
MANPPLTPPEQEAHRLQQQIDELTRQYEELRKQTFSPRFIPSAGRIQFAPDELVFQSAETASPAPPPVVTSPTASVIPAWLTPILQGITVLIIIGAVFWVGQITGTTNTKIDNLQNSVDKLNDWKDTASISLGSLNTKVENLNSKIDDLSRIKK